MLCWFLLSCNVNVISIHICFSSWASLPPSPPISLRNHRAPAELPVSYSSFSTILYTVVYFCQCYSLNLSHPLLLPLCPQVHSLFLHLYSCPENRFISTIFSRFHMYVLVNIFSFFFSLSFWFVHIVWQNLGRVLQWNHLVLEIFLGNCIIISSISLIATRL